MSPAVDVLLFGAAAIAGGLNSVAGGGSFVMLPALLSAGVPPVSANATSALGAWPGSISSAFAYRRDIRASSSMLWWLTGVSLAGGLVGGLLLVRTSDTSFMRLLPWLMLFAAAAFTFGHHLVPRRLGAGGLQHVSMLGVLLQLAIATYGGYFGGGMGIMMLAMMAVAGMTDIHEMNGIKCVLGVAINGIALVAFVAHGVIAWRPGLDMIAGGVTGGYAGAVLARSIDRVHVRSFVIVIAWGMTAYFFWRQIAR